ncbi:uncharacterized protein LOC143377977 [Andrena cerasifolii]|uniref:uncharacterized protein LOC143377977 n=1 Tax=Andrena cerasifolii TaxID=2819439 RepID=UPI004037EA86
MQTEVPTLPVVHFNGHKNSDRRQNSKVTRSAAEAKFNLPHKNIVCLQSNRKNLHPLLGRPYQSSVRQQPPSEHLKLKRNSVEQRVLSARMLRVKELQNQLADAHYQLNELANENRLLKALQKRQDSALKRYEGTNAELPRIINSHHEELRVLQIKYKKLKILHKETCDLLKEKENELQQLQFQNKHLLQLSKDRNLGEREKLQLQVSDLNHRVEQQQNTIQSLHRKLTLESKSLKHQLHVEISKRKETQKNLEEAIEKLRSVEHLLDNRERKLYYNGHLVLPNRNRHFGTRSLTNLRDISSSNPLKLSGQSKNWQADAQENNLPMLPTPELNDKSAKADGGINSNQSSDSMRTETMANLEQVRKYRLQKSSHRKISSDDSEEKSKELDFKMNENLERLEAQDEDHPDQYEINADKFRKIHKNRRYQDFNELTQEKLACSSEDSDNENEKFKDNCSNAASNSNKLCARLASSSDDNSDSKKLAFSNCKCTDKLNVLVQERKDSYESDSEAEAEIRRESIKRYLSLNHQIDGFELISPIHGDETTSRFLNESQKIHKNLISELQAETESVENENFYNLQYDIEHIGTSHIKHNSNKFPEDFQKYVSVQSTPPEEEEEDNDIREDDLEDTSLQTLSMKEFNQLETLFKASDKLESKTPSVESLDEPSAKNSLNSLKNLDEGQMPNMTRDNEAETTNKNALADDYHIETRNKLNKHEANKELENVEALSNNEESCESTPTREASNDIDNTIIESSATTRVVSYNKEKLLATMRAIDDNENIEYINKDYAKHNVTSRRQITENLFRGLPTHARRKQDIIKHIFETEGIKNEPAGSCNKLH